MLAASALPIEEVSLGDLDDYLVPFRTVQGAEAWRNNGDWLRATARPDPPWPSASGAAAVTAADESAACALAPCATRCARPRRRAAAADRARSGAVARSHRRAGGCRAHEHPAPDDAGRRRPPRAVGAGAHGRRAAATHRSASASSRAPAPTSPSCASAAPSARITETESV
jgi:hypothetical protein